MNGGSAEHYSSERHSAKSRRTIFDFFALENKSQMKEVCPTTFCDATTFATTTLDRKPFPRLGSNIVLKNNIGKLMKLHVF